MNRFNQKNMKTSTYQFEVMVTYMEEHGDLCRPYLSAKERLMNLNRWEELTSMLNCDVSGDSKNSTKWKKVWADLKNNTKKKFIRIQQRTSTQDGPVLTTKMSDLEQRVLNLIGLQMDAEDPVAVEEPASSHDEEPVEKKPKLQQNYARDPLRFKKLIRSSDHTYTTYHSPHKPFTDVKWRHFKLQQHKDYLELKREQIRIREMEVQAQLGWQEIGNRAIELLDKIVDKYCKD